jgi:predicted Fe-S protein YdhL (DUF1289 family)
MSEINIKTIYCKRCERDLPENHFWTQKGRNKRQHPCKECRNAQKRLRRKEMYINNRFHPAELIHNYRMKDLSPELVDTMKNVLILKREIRRSMEVLLVGDKTHTVLLCPVCSENEILVLPLSVKELLVLSQEFSKHHGYHCKKQTPIS